MPETRVFTLLVVDDDPLIHQSVRLSLPPHWRIRSVMKLHELEDQRISHAALVDVHLGHKGKEGLDVLKRLGKEHPETECIAMSGDLSRDIMESCLKAGAQRFLAKPLEPEELLLILAKIEALWTLRQGGTRQSQRWIGNGSASKRLLQHISNLKGEPGPILIEGESGTGKEVVAHLLRQQEPEERPFVSVNVAAIPENLFDSELFGHQKGAFTGADRDRMGLCESASGGDLFLDEIETLTAAAQAKLLRFLESGEVRRVGASHSLKVRVRVIAASNRPLDQMTREGHFREDLYFRLAGKKLQLPPLRERLEDLPELARHFVENEKPRRHKNWADDGLEELAKFKWPGNVRELKRACEQLCLVSPLPLLRREDVQAWLSPLAGTATLNLSGVSAGAELEKGLNSLMLDCEKSIIKAALAREPDIEKAADLLQISRSSLYKKIKDHQLENPS